MDFIPLATGIFIIQLGIQTNLLPSYGWKETIVNTVTGLIEIDIGAYLIDKYIHTLL